MKNKIKAAQTALLEAKSAFDNSPTDEAATLVETKATELSTLVEMNARVSKATEAKGLVFDGDIEESEAMGRLTGSVAQKFLDSAEYKKFQGLGGSASNSERQIALPEVKLGDYAEVMESKAALTTDLAFPQAVRYPMIDQTIKPELELMDLIAKGRINADSLQYVQVVSVTRNAALQPENTGTAPDATPGEGVVPDTLKPLSELATNIESASVFGYADGYVVTTQMLADSAAFASFMDNELRTSIRAVQEEYLLNGSGSNGEPRGILNTTGLQGLSYDGSGAQPIRNLVEKVRTGMRKVREVGGTTTAVLLHPEDNEAIDLMKDSNGNYVFGGPANTGVQTLWGRPRVVSEKIEKGTVLLGDFKQVAYLDRDGISVQAFNQHEDFARRNLVYVRAEARGLQAIWRPARLVLLEAA